MKKRRAPLDAMDRMSRLSDGLVEVPVDSLEASVGYGSLLRQMHRTFVERVAYHRSAAGGALSVEEAREAAFHPCRDEEESARQFENLMRMPLESLSFVDLMELHANDPFIAEWFWIRAKEEGRAEFESGHLAANTAFPGGYMKDLWNVARYIGARESFADEWQPRGGIEISMIEMLAQCYFQWQYWVEQTVLRSRTEPRRPDREYEEWRAMRAREQNQGRQGNSGGHWDPPYASELEALEHAVQMADR